MNNFYQLGQPKRQSAGFTMIELIIALAILSFGIVGVYEAISPLFSATYNTSNKLIAVNLAQEGMEIARNIRDNNFIESAGNPSILWSRGLSGCELGCRLDYKTTSANQLQPYLPAEFLKINADGFYGYDSGDNTIFKRKITASLESGTDILRVSSLVEWSFNGKPFSYEATAYLHNWH